MLETLRRVVRRPSPEELMQREHDEARRSLLEALSARDHAEASVAYHEARIARLRKMLAADESTVRLTIGAAP